MQPQIISNEGYHKSYTGSDVYTDMCGKKEQRKFLNRSIILLKMCKFCMYLSYSVI